MKLCRIGLLGKEKPAIIDIDNNYRDLSSIIKELSSSEWLTSKKEKINIPFWLSLLIILEKYF